MMPTVSVIIPYYNRAHTIGRAIDSVLRQTMSDFEILVVDDASSDEVTVALAPYAGDARVRLLRHAANRGPGAARNTGVAAARGRFVAFLDSDDLWLPTKLARQTEAALAAADPDKVFCVTKTRVVLDGGREIVRPLRGPGPGRSFAEFLYVEGGFAQTSAFFLPRALAARFPFREDMRQLEDHLFFIEVGASGAEYVLVEEVLTVWRNESAPDRASSADDLARWTRIVRVFQERAGSLVPRRVLLAGEVRFLSGRLWAVAPARSLALLARALVARALPARQIAFLLARNLLPSGLYDAARHRLGRRSAAIATLELSS
jgi:glycosyltransferase involved in cell wall biosynthesis